MAKLVRDRIPEIIAADGGQAVTETITDPQQLLGLLCEKLGEEADEVAEAPSREELADVLEVLRTIARCICSDMDEVEAARVAKAQARGGFENGVLLVEIL